MSGGWRSADFWLKSGYVPVLPGPEPVAVGGAVLAIGFILMYMFPTACMPSVVSAAVGAAALAMSRKPPFRDGLKWPIAVMAGPLFFWAAIPVFLPVPNDAFINFVQLFTCAVVLGVIRHSACRIYTLEKVLMANLGWSVQDKLAYADLLLQRRRFTGTRDAAFALYRRAAEMTLLKPWHDSADLAVLERCAKVIGRHPRFREDGRLAQSWRDQARALAPFLVDRGAAPGGESTEDGEFGFADGAPLWRIVLDDPGSLLDGEVSFRAFMLPEGALLGCLLAFRRAGGGAVHIHRIFDAAEPATEAWLAASEHHLRWRVEVRAPAQAGAEDGEAALSGAADAVHEVGLCDSGLMSAFAQVFDHNAGLGSDADTAAARSFLMTTFRDHAENYGVEAAWSALQTVCAKDSD